MRTIEGESEHTCGVCMVPALRSSDLPGSHASARAHRLNGAATLHDEPVDCGPGERKRGGARWIIVCNHNQKLQLALDVIGEETRPEVTKERRVWPLRVKVPKKSPDHRQAIGTALELTTLA